MSHKDSKDTKKGYQPLQEGYQPTQASDDRKPPTGGTGRTARNTDARTKKK